MSFSRTAPKVIAGDELTAAMRGIGMRLGSVAANPEADLEQTLVSAIVDAMPTDFRTLGVVVAWFETHSAYVNVPRLLRMAREAMSGPQHLRARAFMAALGASFGATDSRYQTLERLYAGPRVDLDDTEVTDLQVKRRGEDPRFEGTPLRVPHGLLRPRARDVHTPALLAQAHRGYALRVALGPNYRADAWWALERHPDASAADIARVAACAYETARSVKRDFEVMPGFGPPSVVTPQSRVA